MSLGARNLSRGFPTMYDSNKPAQLQRLARISKFCMKQSLLKLLFDK